MQKITVPKADKGYNIAFTATDADDAAYNLTGYTVTLEVWAPDVPDTDLLTGACTIDVAASGTCHYTIVAADFATAGVYHARLNLTKSGVEEKLKPFALVVSFGTYYCTLDEIKSELAIDGDDNNDIIEALCEEVKEWIDDYCDRHFDSRSVTRYFDGDGSVLFVDDLTSITTLKLDQDGDGTYGSTLATTDYQLYPLNGNPKTYIKISSNSNYGGFANGIKKGVEIIGAWGYDTSVPRPIRRAAKIQVCRLFKRKDSSFATVIGSSELGEIEIYKGLDPDVKLILERYRRRTAG